MKVLIVIVFFMLSCREEVEKIVVVQEKSSVDKVGQAVFNFYNALQAGQVEKALQLANNFDLSLGEELPKPYVMVFDQCKVKRDFFVDKKFTQMDFIYWRQALLFKTEADKIKASVKASDDLIQKCYERVRERVKSRDPDPDPAAFPIDIWNRGYGVCDRQSWVLCELAYQLGAEVYIVYFINPETGISPHTICEIVYEGENYVVDPLYGKFLKGTRLSDVTDEKLKKIWTKYPALEGCLEKAKVLSPSMPFDYALRQQALNKLFKKYIPKDDLIHFGEEPQARAKKRPYLKGVDYWFWDYPIRLLSGASFYKNLYPSNKITD